MRFDVLIAENINNMLGCDVFYPGISVPLFQRIPYLQDRTKLFIHWCLSTTLQSITFLKTTYLIVRFFFSD